ncbi:MAG: methyltransferase domain-containing protein [Lachnospiraceae bacterium]|nr:methyltransferase domain-containing protein [Lachnospiraceae bacterium]
MVAGFFIGAAVCALIAVVSGLALSSGPLRTALIIILVLTAVILAVAGIWMLALHNAFSYTGKRQMAKQIIDGVASYVRIPDGGKGLDVGCGSAALTIAAAKNNPNAEITGADIWSGAYKAVFTKELCENNAKAEGVSNVRFEQGNAVALPFENETFDAVFSNYVYHNIPSRDRQSILLESLRVLKPGGTFAIHDIFSKSKYGDMQAFCRKLWDMGYEQVELIDTTEGKFMTRKEAFWMELSGSAILYGRK